MFIVAGELKGRKLAVPSHLKVTEARVKQAIFDILGNMFKDQVVIDLFAGSGALGIEALSWGARRAIFVDKSAQHIRLIKRNLSLLKLESQGELYCVDAFAFLKRFAKESKKSDIVFIDPPYRQGLTTKSLKEIRKYDILASSGLAIGLSFFQEEVEGERYICLFKRRYGDRMVRIFQYNKNDNSLSGNF